MSNQDEIERAINLARDIKNYIQKSVFHIIKADDFNGIGINAGHIEDILLKYSLKQDIAIKGHMSKINSNLDRIYTRLGSQEHKITELNDKVYSMENSIESALEDLKYSIEDNDEDD